MGRVCITQAWAPLPGVEPGPNLRLDPSLRLPTTYIAILLDNGVYQYKIILCGCCKQLTQGGKGSSEGKKVQQILTSKYVMGILNWFKIVKNKKIHEAILEIAVNTHSPFCPKLVDYSACVPPALQNGFVNSFDFDNFESHKHSYTQFWSQTLLDFFSLWVTLATLGVMIYKNYSTHTFCTYILLNAKVTIN